MQSAGEIRETIKKLHVALNRWPHDTDEGREMRAHFGQRIEVLQVAYERMEEVGG